jgi:hypothetical protein
LKILTNPFYLSRIHLKIRLKKTIKEKYEEKILEKISKLDDSSKLFLYHCRVPDKKWSFQDGGL